MKSLFYIANQRMPTEKAYGLQIAKMCEAFGNLGLRVELVVPKRKNAIKENIFDHYGVKRTFSVKYILSPDLYFPGRLDKIAFIIKNILSAIAISLYMINKKGIIFSRDELPLYMLSFFKKDLCFEAHRFSEKRKRLYSRLKETNVKIITISQGIKEDFVSLGFNPTKILVAHDGVDIDEFDIPDSRESCREALDLPQDRKIVGYVGQLTTMGSEKGLAELIQACDRIREESEDILLVIVGGSDEDILEYTAGAEKDHIFFTGRKNHRQIPFYLKAFDVLAMPFPNTRHYARYMSPLKLFEYMASQRPIIASDLPSVREVLNNANAILIEPDNVQALAKGIQLALDDHGTSSRISHQAFIDVQEHTWAKRAKKILEHSS